MSPSHFSRRRFVKTFALGTAVSVVMGKLWRGTVLADMDPSPDPTTATFKIRISDYPALANPLGSVRIGVNPVRDEQEPFPDGEFWPFLVNRGTQGEFFVLDSQCQHASCVVPTFTDAIHCPCHGSTYAIDGKMTTGPTQRDLHKYRFDFDGNDTLTIQIPGLGFSVRAATVTSGNNPRLALTLPTHFNIQYEVQFRERSDDPWEIVPFAMEQDDPADLLLLTEGAEIQTIYVDRVKPTGFFAVSMLLNEV